MLAGIIQCRLEEKADLQPTSTQMLIVSRALMGLAGATLGPSTLSLIFNMFLDPRQRSVALEIEKKMNAVTGTASKSAETRREKMSEMKPVTELHPQFSSEEATPTLWPEARERLEKAEVYWLSTVRPGGVAYVLCVQAESDEQDALAEGVYIVNQRCARFASGLHSEEVQMSWNKWIRQTHRWLSIVFTVLVIVNIVINIIPLAQEELALWVGLLTLLPLALLLFTGLYLFVLPYATKWHSGQRAD